jgi:hypothetical protein
MLERASCRIIVSLIGLVVARATRWERRSPWREERTMHAVLITFHSEASLDELWEPFLESAPAIRDVPGLISKSWLRQGATLGGFYLFTDGDAAQTYLDGAIISEIKAMPAFSDFRVERYDVIEAMSAVTNGLGGAAVGARG